MCAAEYLRKSNFQYANVVLLLGMEGGTWSWMEVQLHHLMHEQRVGVHVLLRHVFCRSRSNAVAHEGVADVGGVAQYVV